MRTEIKSVVQRVRRPRNVFLGLLFLLTLFVLSLGPPIEAGPQQSSTTAKPSSVSVWYADGSSLFRVDTATGKAAGRVTLPSSLAPALAPASALAPHPTDGSVAVLAKGRLLGFDASGKKTFDVALQSPTAASVATVLASDPQDGTLWVGGNGVVVIADSRGKNQRTVNIGDTVVAQAVAHDGSAWVLSDKRLLHLSKGGQILSERKMPHEGVSTPKRLALDEFGNYAYVANDQEIAQIDLQKQGGVPPVRKLQPAGGVQGLAINPFNSTLYAANQSSQR
jgi:DNA-binding beta-propeller fold protein YncE